MALVSSRIASNRIPVIAQLVGDASNRPFLRVESEYSLLSLHPEYIGNADGYNSGLPDFLPPSGLVPHVVHFEAIHFDPGWYILSDRRHPFQLPAIWPRQPCRPPF